VAEQLTGCGVPPFAGPRDGTHRGTEERSPTDIALPLSTDRLLLEGAGPIPIRAGSSRRSATGARVQRAETPVPHSTIAGSPSPSEKAVLAALRGQEDRRAAESAGPAPALVRPSTRCSWEAFSRMRLRDAGAGVTAVSPAPPPPPPPAAPVAGRPSFGPARSRRSFAPGLAALSSDVRRKPAPCWRRASACAP